MSLGEQGDSQPLNLQFQPLQELDIRFEDPQSVAGPSVVDSQGDGATPLGGRGKKGRSGENIKPRKRRKNLAADTGIEEV